MWENRPNAVEIHQTRGFLPGDKLLANQLSSDLDDGSGITFLSSSFFNAPLLQVNGWIIWTRLYLGFLSIILTTAAATLTAYGSCSSYDCVSSPMVWIPVGWLCMLASLLLGGWSEATTSGKL